MAAELPQVFFYTEAIIPRQTLPSGLLACCIKNRFPKMK